MLWSQYKSATIRCSEFLRKQITRIPNIANWNYNFLTLQTLEFQKKMTGIIGIKNGIGIPLTMRVLEIKTKNWNSQPSSAHLPCLPLHFSPHPNVTPSSVDCYFFLGGCHNHHCRVSPPVASSLRHHLLSGTCPSWQ